jgi:pimeloyl-ACP methyl ester carboxylesterase
MRRASIAAVLILFSAACTADSIPETTAAAVQETPATAAAVTEQSAEEDGSVVKVLTDDGLPLAATFTQAIGGPPRPGVILFHMLGSDRSAWLGLSQALAEHGISSLAVDLRGHGETGSDPDWELTQDDLRAIWDYFTKREDVAPNQIALIGASIGSNLALQLGASTPEARGVVLLSPGLDYQGVVTDRAMLEYSGRPALIVVSAEDTYAANSSRTLQQLGGESVVLELTREAGHGTNMLLVQPELIDQIIAWLKQQMD